MMRTLAFVACALVACSDQRATERASPDAANDRGDVVRTTVTDRVTYTFRASRWTNLLYQLDCLAGLHRCSHAAFAEDWKASGWTPDDDQALAAWAALRRRHTGLIDEPPREAEAPLPIPYRPRDVGTAVRVAGYGARDLDDYAARLARFADAAEVAEAKAILARFADRAEARWRAQRAALATHLDDYVALGERADVRALLGSIASFYAIGDAGTVQVFDLVGRPAHASSSSAEQLVELAVVEARAGEPAVEQYAVITHEMFHAWFAAAPIASQVALVERFLASGDPLAGPSWGLLDEVLATALGNGLVQRLVDRDDHDRRLSMPRGFYDDPFVDAVAKALLPALERRLAARGSVFDEDFVAEYLAAVRAAFPTGLPPITHLRPLLVVNEPSLAPSARHLMERANPGYVMRTDAVESATGLVRQHAAWGKAILWTRDRIDDLAPLLDRALLAQVRAQAATGQPFVVARRGAPTGTLFVLVADDAASMTALVDQLAATADLRDGVIVP